MRNDAWGVFTGVCVYKVNTNQRESPDYPRTYLKEWERHPQLRRNTSFLFAIYPL